MKLCENFVKKESLFPFLKEICIFAQFQRKDLLGYKVWLRCENLEITNKISDSRHNLLIYKLLHDKLMGLDNP